MAKNKPPHKGEKRLLKTLKCNIGIVTDHPTEDFFSDCFHKNIEILLPVLRTATEILIIDTRPVPAQSLSVVARPVPAQSLTVVTRPVPAQSLTVVTRPVPAQSVSVVARPVPAQSLTVVAQPVPAKGVKLAKKN